MYPSKCRENWTLGISIEGLLIAHIQYSTVLVPISMDMVCLFLVCFYEKCINVEASFIILYTYKLYRSEFLMSIIVAIIGLLECLAVDSFSSSWCCISSPRPCFSERDLLWLRVRRAPGGVGHCELNDGLGVRKWACPDTLGSRSVCLGSRLAAPGRGREEGLTLKSKFILSLFKQLALHLRPRNKTQTGILPATARGRWLIIRLCHVY